MRLVEHVVVCDGTEVDDHLRPVGDPCGARFEGFGDDKQRQASVARDIGWSIGPNGEAMCPSCRRPPREVTALVRQVARRG